MCLSFTKISRDKIKSKHTIVQILYYEFKDFISLFNYLTVHKNPVDTNVDFAKLV